MEINLYRGARLSRKKAKVTYRLAHLVAWLCFVAKFLLRIFGFLMFWYVIWQIPNATLKLIAEYREYCTANSIEIAAVQVGQLDKMTTALQGMALWEGSLFTGLITRFGILSTGANEAKYLFIVELLSLAWLVWKIYKSIFVSGAASIFRAYRLPPHIYGTKYFAEHRKLKKLEDAINFVKASAELKESCNKIAKKSLPRNEYKKYKREMDSQFDSLIDFTAQKEYGSDFSKTNLRQLKIQKRNHSKRLKKERKLAEKNPRDVDAVTEILYYKCHQMYQVIWGMDTESHVDFEAGKEFDREQDIADMAMNEVVRGIIEDLIERFKLANELNQEQFGWSKIGEKFTKKCARWKEEITKDQMQIETLQNQVELWEGNPADKEKYQSEILKTRKEIKKLANRINKRKRQMDSINVDKVMLKDIRAHRKSEMDFNRQTKRLMDIFYRKSRRRNRKKNRVQGKIYINRKSGYSIFKSFADYLRGNILGCAVAALGLLLLSGIMGSSAKYHEFAFDFYKMFFTGAQGWLLFIILGVGILFYFILGLLAGNVLEIERDDKDDFYRNLSIVRDDNDKEHLYFEEVGRIRKNTAKRFSSLNRINREYGLTLFMFRNIFQVLFTFAALVFLLLMYKTEAFNLVADFKALTKAEDIFGKIIPLVKWVLLALATGFWGRAFWYTFSRNEFRTITMHEDCRNKAKVWYRLMMALVAFFAVVCLALFIVDGMMGWGALKASNVIYFNLGALVLTALIGMSTDIALNPREPDADVGVDFFSDDGNKRDPDDGPYVDKMYK